MADPTNPNDPQFSGDPEHYVFVNGRWQYRDSAASGNAPAASGSVKAETVGNPGSMLGLLSGVPIPGTVLGADAPGASLVTTQPDADRARMAGLLGQLQTQATTGGGAWEQALAQNTAGSNATASALGQSLGEDNMSASRAIGNATAGNNQRAVGQGNLLRAQTQQAAQGQIADILAGQSAMDAQQSAASAAVNQGRAMTNADQHQRSTQKAWSDLGAVGQTVLSAIGGGMSEGGEVPGQPRVFGDDELNDIVPAKLSPGEIVIPRSIATGPNAPEASARFVAAVQARGQSSGPNFDEGGQVGPYGETDARGVLRNDSSAGDGGFTMYGSRKAPASIDNGALLDTTKYNETRDASLANADNFMSQYLGKGPSVAPQAFQNATDSTINDAMKARAPIGDVVGGATQQQQGAAGNAAGIVAGESQRGAEAFASAVQRQRAQNLALAHAEQQAAWRNSMLNAGVGLQQQGQLSNLLSGSGQAAVAAAGMFGGRQQDGDSDYNANATGIADNDKGAIDDAFNGYGDYEIGEGGYAAEGGIVVSHLARRGTHKAPLRPGSQRARPGEPPRVAKTQEEERPYRTQEEMDGPISRDDRYRVEDMGSKISKAERKKYDRENPDLMDLHPEGYADGGKVLPAFFPLPPPQAEVAPGSMPAFFPSQTAGQPQTSRIPDALRALASILPRHPDELRGEDWPISPEAQAERLATSPGAGPQWTRPVSDARPPNAPVKSSTSSPPQAPSAAAPQPPRAAAPRTAAPKSPGVAPSDPYAEQQRAAGMRAEVEGTQATEQAGILGGLQKSLEANAVAQEEMRSRASSVAQSQLMAIQQARDDMKGINTTVDPGRFWEDRGVPGKIAAVIGLALGALGNDNGVNRSAQLLNQMIDRDIDAQKASFELALRKGQSGIDSAQNIYALSRQQSQDDIAAGLAAKGTALDLAKNQIDIAAAKAGAPMAKANLANLSAQIGLEKQKADEALKQRGFDNAIKSGHLALEREAAGVKAQTAGAAVDKTQKALLDTITTEESTIKQQGEKLKSLIKKHGTAEVMNGEVEAEMRQAVNAMAVAAAKMNDPASAARSSEVEMEAKNIFKPGFFQRPESALKTIDSYLSNAEQRKRNAYSARGVSAGEAASSGQPAAKPGVRRMRLPSGEVVEVR